MASSTAPPTPPTPPTPTPSKEHLKCVRMKDMAVSRPRVSFMLDAIKALGCNIGEDPAHSFISCAKLDGTKAGGFQTQGGGADPHIYLGENTGYGPRQVEQTLTHELIHAVETRQNIRQGSNGRTLY